ncbi:hypothetical protein HaLaN_09298 [Haematococcus lacustris]|uniref:Uncharacterized protein n=1 Tax=Haematococcus lacustris TaxID=44745 RepID=A0A699YT83_HAELA|nr:hypothetical protein HaLaN_09298 [Haematococcus lacustris]
MMAALDALPSTAAITHKQLRGLLRLLPAREALRLKAQSATTLNAGVTTASALAYTNDMVDSTVQV